MKYQNATQDAIRVAPRFAFRKGALRFRGWKCDARDVQNMDTKARDLQWEPVFQQKEMDMKIGLDIAWLASKSIVDIVAIVTGDTDFVPAMKFARREGAQVRLVTFSHNASRAHNTLLEHSDDVKCVDLAAIAKAR